MNSKNDVRLSFGYSSPSKYIQPSHQWVMVVNASPRGRPATGHDGRCTAGGV